MGNPSTNRHIFFVFLISVTQCTSGYRSQTGYKTRSVNNGRGGFTCFPGTLEDSACQGWFFFREKPGLWVHLLRQQFQRLLGGSKIGCLEMLERCIGARFWLSMSFSTKPVQWKMSILERNNNTWFGAIFHWTRICRDRGVLNEIGIYDLRF